VGGATDLAPVAISKRDTNRQRLPQKGHAGQRGKKRSGGRGNKEELQGRGGLPGEEQHLVAVQPGSCLGSPVTSLARDSPADVTRRCAAPRTERDLAYHRRAFFFVETSARRALCYHLTSAPRWGSVRAIECARYWQRKRSRPPGQWQRKELPDLTYLGYTGRSHLQTVPLLPFSNKYTGNIGVLAVVSTASLFPMHIAARLRPCWRGPPGRIPCRRAFSASPLRREIRDMETLPPRIIPRYQGVVNKWCPMVPGEFPEPLLTYLRRSRIPRQRSSLPSVAGASTKRPACKEGECPGGD